ncbi:Fic family protein [Candidatus Saccharibacteria bacterium]|nr:Fic family protein [Candidatus Saccharibacteria bacterium]MBQ9017109.1 Fic family protein [Candidatus Saccharibacteria bacterium]
MQDPYCYPNSSVLKNKLGIIDEDELYNEERNFTNLREEELLRSQILGKFDLKHLQDIHHYLFQDIYDWAGKIRTVDIAKGNLFCKVELIRPQAEIIFNGLKSEKYLRGLGTIQFTNRLAYYLGEINALHPFREGNGRSEREFIRELAFQNGYFLSFKDITQKELIETSKSSFLGDYSSLANILGRSLRPQN